MGRHGRQRIQDSFRLEHMTEKLLAAYGAARQERASMAKPVPDRSRSGVCGTSSGIPAGLNHCGLVMERTGTRDGTGGEHELDTDPASRHV